MYTAQQFHWQFAIIRSRHSYIIQALSTTELMQLTVLSHVMSLRLHKTAAHSQNCHSNQYIFNNNYNKKNDNDVTCFVITDIKYSIRV